MFKKMLFIIAAVLLILFLPVPGGTLRSGATRTYSAIAYKVVEWNRLEGGDAFHKVSVYWFPDNFRSVEELWEKEAAHLAQAQSDGSVFVWEKEGFGGDFAILLRYDGTYAYYVGPLSSYIGTGSWTLEDGIITLKDDTGYGFVHRFRNEDKVLRYIAEGSDGFMGVKVSDGDRFLLSGSATVTFPTPIYHQIDPVLVIQAGEKELRVWLENNTSVKDLIRRLSFGDITLEMQDYGGFEKVGELPWDLPRNDEKMTAVPGDVILYLGNRITVYYGSNTWDLTRLGHIDGTTREELLEVFGDGSATVRMYLEWNER